MWARIASLISAGLLIGAVSVRGWADDSVYFSYIRLDRPGYSMASVPVTDQKGIPLCYAFAAAQMIDAFRFTHQQNEDFPQKQNRKRTSPLAAAVEASWDTGLTYFETLNYGGFLCEALDSILKYGSCQEEKTRDLFASIKGFKNSGSEKDKGEMVRKFGSSFKGKVYRSPLVENNFSEAGEGGDRYSKSLAQRPLDGWPGPREQMRVFKNLVDRSCRPGRESLEHLNISCVEIQRKNAERQSGHALLGILHRQMNKGRLSQPVGLKYCANFLEEGPSYRGMKGQVRENGKILWREDCLIHYSLVIGRRQRDGLTEFLVRDSYGKDCGGSSLHSHWTCDRGSIWVSSEILLGNILEVNFLASNEVPRNYE